MGLFGGMRLPRSRKGTLGSSPAAADPASGPGRPLTEAEYILLKSVDETRSYCPGCEPDVDPLTGLVNVCYCGEHFPGVAGVEDRTASPLDPFQTPTALYALPDAGGEHNRVWCNMIHRKEVTP